MFERFTDRARRVVVLAQEEARGLGHSCVGTEHVLLGLVREGEGVAAKALEGLGVSLDAVRLKVGEIIEESGAPLLGRGHIAFTPRAKHVFELSLREALQLGHNYIGTEHLLLALIREGEGVAAQALVGLGCDLSRARQAVIRLLVGYGDVAAEESDHVDMLIDLARTFGTRRQADYDRAISLVDELGLVLRRLAGTDPGPG